MALDKVSPAMMSPQSVGETAPSEPYVGQRWYRASTAVTYQYTNDGTSSFWLDVTSGGIGTSASRGIDFVGDIDPHKATNGSGLAVGSVYYNREGNRHFVCTDNTSGANVWSGRYSGIGGIVTDYVSGGTYYRVHTFLNNGTFVMDGTTSIDYLVVGGGAGGGTNEGGGGGAGGFRTGAGLSISSGTYEITVGNGGLGGGAPSLPGGQGGISIFSSITATGGGAGTGQTGGTSGKDGGSGGGATRSGSAGSGIYNGAHTLGLVTHQGRNGGIGNGSYRAAAGGGGASAVGANASSAAVAGAGGAGATNAYRTGSNVTYAGGGGGGSWGNGNAGGAGGAGGGATGNSTGVAVPTPATVNTGGGGGGGGSTAVGATVAGGAGGSGIVVIRYAL